MPLEPLGHEVDAAFRAVVDSEKRIVLRVAPADGRRERMLAARCGVQLSADKQNCVAYFFGVETTARLPSEPMITHAQPEPKRPAPALLNSAFSASKLPKD